MFLACGGTLKPRHSISQEEQPAKDQGEGQQTNHERQQTIGVETRPLGVHHDRLGMQGPNPQHRDVDERNVDGPDDSDDGG